MPPRCPLLQSACVASGAARASTPKKVRTRMSTGDEEFLTVADVARILNLTSAVVGARIRWIARGYR